MHSSDRKLVYLLWAVIAVLVIGFVALGILAVKQISVANDKSMRTKGDNQSLKRQVDQLHQALNPTPSPTPVPTVQAIAPVAATPTPAPVKKR